MNLKELFNKLFKLGTKNYGLALPTDLVSVPMRDNLDADKIKELDEYKKNYLETLSQKKYFTSHDIASQDFNQEILMNFELFGRLIANRDDIYDPITLSTSTVISSEHNELWFKQNINPRKIKLYIDKMKEMYNETHLRLVALKEIYSEFGKRLSKDKRNAILNEIYNLTSNYIIFKNNVYAALNEVKTYENETSYDQYTEDYNHLFEKLILFGYGSNLAYHLNKLIPDKLNEIKHLSLPILDTLAHLERELEIYAYKYLNVDELNRELEKIDKIEKIPGNKKMLLDRINELETKYVILNDFGRYQLDLKPLYEIKFDILTIDIINQNDSPFKSIPAGRKLKYYEDIILDRLYINITGVDSLLSQRLDDEHKYLIQYFVELLKYDNLNLNLILQSTFSLSLVLSAVSDEKMNYFFNNYQINIKNNNLPYRFASKIPSCGFIVEDTLPLSTICWINNLDILAERRGPGFVNKDRATNMIVAIYDYFADKENENSLQYKIPEGITEITIINSSYGYAVMEEILNASDGKTLVMPNSLKTLKTLTYSNYDHKSSVILNEGLEKVSAMSLIGYFTSSLTIPSTLKNAYDSVLKNTLYNPNEQAEDTSCAMEELTFTNCEESITLHDLVQMNDIIKRLCELSLFRFKGIIDYTGISPFISKYYVSNLIPCNIVLVSKDGHKITISINEIFTQQMHNNKKYLFNQDFEESIINIIKEKISDVINNETKTTNKKK